MASWTGIDYVPEERTCDACDETGLYYRASVPRKVSKRRLYRLRNCTPLLGTSPTAALFVGVFHLPRIEMLASLPMYDPFVGYESSDSIWSAVRAGSGREGALPQKLDKFSSCYTVWTSGPKLTLTQSCGYPLVREYSDFLQVVGTPLYSAPGCAGCTYRSALIVSDSVTDRTLSEYLRNNSSLTLATNSFGSYSGWLMLLSIISDTMTVSPELYAQQRKISRAVLTGSHIGSIKAVQGGSADLACIDCVSFALAAVHCPLLMKGIRVIGWSLPAPALPFVTHKDATAEEVAALRKGLTFMMHSTDVDTMVARQQHLLAGVDISGRISFDNYKKAVDQHIAIATAHPETAALLAALPTGRPPRECFSVLVPVLGSDSAQASVQVDLMSRLEDARWPTADFTTLHSLKRFFARYLWDVVHAACCNASGVDDIAVAARSSPIDQVLTVDLLCRALLPIVGQHLWPVLPDGGKPKLIFCSLRGALLLLRCMHTDRSGGARCPIDHTVSADDICAHPTWKTIARTARAALQHIEDLTQGATEVSNSTADTTPGSVEDEPDFFWAGFMGAAAASLYEYFPEEYLTSGDISSVRNMQEGSTSDVISKLWAADISLSAHLIRSSAKGGNGMIAYISAPRHNDRHDWANLVLTEDEAAIERWRDSRGHTSVRTHVAPWSYDHIRLHRGVLTGGLSGAKMNLKRTVFLGSKETPTAVPSAESQPSTVNLPEMDADEKALSVLRIVGSATAGRGSSSGCPASGSAARGLERHVVYWADIAPHGNSGASPAADAVSASESGNRKVPGGVHVTLSEFKAQLLDEARCPFVYVDETMTSPQ